MLCGAKKLSSGCGILEGILVFRSPDGAKRNPEFAIRGRDCPPDFASLHPGYDLYSCGKPEIDSAEQKFFAGDRVTPGLGGVTDVDRISDAERQPAHDFAFALDEGKTAIRQF